MEDMKAYMVDNDNWTNHSTKGALNASMIKNTKEWVENHDLSHRLPSFSSIY
jgi:hypothetical protein